MTNPCYIYEHIPDTCWDRQTDANQPDLIRSKEGQGVTA